MPYTLGDPGVRQNQQLQQFGQRAQQDAQTAVNDRALQGQNMWKQGMEYAASRGISLQMALDENPELAQSMFTGLMYANKGNRNVSEQMWNAAINQKATADQLFNYQMNKVFDGIDLDQPLFDQYETYQRLKSEGGEILQDGVKLDDAALMDLASTMTVDTAIWSPIADFIGAKAAEYYTDEEGNQIPKSWGEPNNEFNQVRDKILQAYIGIPLSQYLATDPKSAERKAYDKRLIEGMKSGQSNLAQVVMEGAENVGAGAQGGGGAGGSGEGFDFGANTTLTPEEQAVVRENMTTLDNFTGTMQNIEEPEKRNIFARAYDKLKRKMQEANMGGQQVGDGTVLGFLEATQGQGVTATSDQPFTVLPSGGQALEDASSTLPEAPVPTYSTQDLPDTTFFNRDATVSQPEYETATKKIPGWFTQFDTAEDLIRAQGGEAAQRSRISDVELRQAEAEILKAKASARLMGAQADALITEAMAGPGMSETDRDNLATNRDLLEKLYDKQINTNIIKDFKNVKDINDWNNNVKIMYDTFAQYNIPLGTMQIRKENIFGQDRDVYYIGPLGPEITGSSGQPDESTVAWATNIGG